MNVRCIFRWLLLFVAVASLWYIDLHWKNKRIALLGWNDRFFWVYTENRRSRTPAGSGKIRPGCSFWLFLVII